MKFGDNVTEKCDGKDYIPPASKTVRDLEVQLVLSLILGVGAFIAFCVSRSSRYPHRSRVVKRGNDYRSDQY